MNFFEKIETVAKKPVFFALLLFVAASLFRLPTLFNDYYDADELAAIVQTREYLAGGVPGVDFSESKLPLYHAIFKLSYSIWLENGWVVVHAFTIIIVWLTALGIYFAGKAIRGPSTGALASLIYAIFISSFNRHFMATNGEIVFNLPIAWGFFFLIMHLKPGRASRFLFLAGAIIMTIAAFYVKFHGIILGIFLLFFFFLYRPFWNRQINKKYLLTISISLSACALALMIDYFTINFFASDLLQNIHGKLYYALVKGFDPLIFTAKYVHRQGLLALWHFAAWLPACTIVIRFTKNKFRFSTLEESAVLAFFILSYLLVFAGGSRLYHHYFMAAYPALSLAAALAIVRGEELLSLKIRKSLFFGMAIPALFFFAWNTKDIIIKHFHPNAFYKEGPVLYWARAVLVGHFNDYLLPENSYRNAAEFIKENTHPGERIFVWGDGPYLYYFSQRRMGIKHLWPKTTVIRIYELYKKGDPQSLNEAKNIERYFVEMIKIKKPILFIDTSENGLTGFVYPLTPVLKEYVRKEYFSLTTVDKMIIYKLKENETLYKTHHFK